MYHDFWLFREGERAYSDYHDLLTRSDAPIRLDEHLFNYFANTLVWIPTFDITRRNVVRQTEDWSGPTIVNETGGLALQQVCLAWKQLFACGPAQLRLRGLFRWNWPFEEKERVFNMMQIHCLGTQEYVEVDRDWLLQLLTTLAHFASQTSTGEYFLLHLSI